MEMFTLAKCIYYILTFNSVFLVAMVFKREAVNFVIKHKLNAQILLSATVMLLALRFFRKNISDLLFNLYLAIYHTYTNLHGNVPKNTKQTNIEFVIW